MLIPESGFDDLSSTENRLTSCAACSGISTSSAGLDLTINATMAPRITGTTISLSTKLDYKGWMKYVVILLFFGVLSDRTMAQASVPPLERKVKLDFTAERVQVVLQAIESQAGVSFSYASSLVPANMTVSLSMNNRSVREALDKIFSGGVTYKSRNNHIILTKAPVQQKVIEGYVENARGEKLKGASVYDPSTMASATTDEYGYFEMKIRRTTPLQLQVSKSSYSDTIMPLQPASPTLQHIVMEERKDSTLHVVLNVMKSSTDSVVTAVRQAGQWIKEQMIWNENLRNIRDSLYRPFQVSLVPFVGTNGRLSANVVNDFSWNILAGYNGGVNMVEFAGLMNIDKANVSYLQFAGLSNIVGGNLRGVQFAGFNNINLGSTKGVQFAGFSNLDMEKMDGLQFTGFSNFCGDSVKGVQFSGFSNIVTGHLKGAQMAGFGNIATGGFDGAQVAGFFNVSGKSARGVQMSGFINIARNLKGAQIGVFNFADSLTGIPVGFFSFVRNGYHKLEFAYDDMAYAHVAVRSGVRHFYNIISAGVRTDWNVDTVDWTFAYGLGVAPRISNRIDLNIDLTANQVVHGNIGRELNCIARLQTGIDVHLTKRISVFGAVVMNGYFFEENTRLMTGYDTSASIYAANMGNGYSFDSWLGWKAGIRIF